MGLKRDLRTLADFSDNPFDAKYRPKREMNKLFFLIQLWLLVLLGFSHGVCILITGPLSIYWIVVFVRARQYWKDLGRKMRFYYIPTAIVFILGLYLALSGDLLRGCEYVINRFVFYI